MVLDQHQRALREGGVDAAGGVGEDDAGDTPADHRAHAEDGARDVMPLVEMGAAGQRRDPRPGRVRADDELAGMPDHRR